MKTENITISKKLTLEEAAAFKEPETIYEDENGVYYQLTDWELEEKQGEEKRIPMEKQVRYLGLEDGEEIPETIYEEAQPQQSGLTEAPENQSVEALPTLSGALHKTEIKILDEQWKDDLCVPVTFYSYGADEYQLGDIIISTDADNLLEETAKKGPLILDSLSLSPQTYHIASIIWNGEPFTDENGQLCRNAIALGERLLKDIEVVYNGEAIWKEPDYYELHAVYQAEEKEAGSKEGSTVAIVSQTADPLPDPAPNQGPFWYLIRTGFVITVAVGILGILTGILLLIFMKYRKKEEKDHF